MTLLGRNEELGSLRGALEHAAQGRRAVVMVEGEAGIGKSALVQEALREGGPDRGYIFYGAADRLGRGLPFGLLATVLGLTPEIEEGPLAEVARILFRIERETGVLRFRVIETTLDALENLAEERPIVLVFEDLHWSDEPTLTFINRFLGRSEFVRMCSSSRRARTRALLRWQRLSTRSVAPVRRRFAFRRSRPMPLGSWLFTC